MFRFAIAFAGLALAAAAPASASTVITMTGSDSLTGTFGNAYTFSSGGISVRASAWRATRSGSVWSATSAYLGRYGNGLGATSTGDGNGGNNLHTIENSDGVDFVLLQFNQNVTISSLQLSNYAIGSTTDNDAFVSSAISALPWTSTINLASNNALLGSLVSAGASIKSAAGLPSTRATNYNIAGNVWIVGADFFNTDNFDGFKLTSVTVAPAIPEPETWAMLIAGFAGIGMAARRRKPAYAIA